MIRLSGFGWVPPFAVGMAQDLRARWALEEAGFAYEVLATGHDEQQPHHRVGGRTSPRGTFFEEDGIILVQPGPIILHIADRAAALTPADPDERARVKGWMLETIGTIEPHIGSLVEIDFSRSRTPAMKQRRIAAFETVTSWLRLLDRRLSSQEHLESRFSAADLLTVTALRMLRHTDLVARLSSVDEYRVRCEARVAFRKAIAAQLAPYGKPASAKR